MPQRLIYADTFRHDMYHEAFERDTDEQKWDSGCWIRYKMVERILESQPTVDAVPVVRCKDCTKREYCRTSTVWAMPPKDDWFCADGERREEE